MGALCNRTVSPRCEFSPNVHEPWHADFHRTSHAVNAEVPGYVIQLLNNDAQHTDHPFSGSEVTTWLLHHAFARFDQVFLGSE